MSDQVELRPEFPALDTLRAVGAVAVLTTHVAFQTGEYFRHGTWGTVLARLDVGVAIFFVLSGFLLSRPWWAGAATATSRPHLATYARKRTARIAPIYLVSAVLALALLPDNSGRGVASWIRTLTMTDVYFDRTLPHGLTQMWSLAAEVAFYAALPALMWLCLRRNAGLSVRRSNIVLVAMVVGTVVWLVWGAEALSDMRAWAPGLWLPGYLTWFAAGMWLAREHVLLQLGTPTRIGRAIVDLGRQPGVVWTMVVGLMLVCGTPLAGPVTLAPATDFEAVVKSFAYAAIGVLLVAAGMQAGNRGIFGRLFSNRLLRHFGHVSYSVFCLHLLVLAALVAYRDYQLFTGDFPLMWLMTLAGSLVVSEIAYRVVERPAMRLFRPRASNAAQHATDTMATTTT